MNEQKERLRVKDLVSTGIFSALLLVLVVIGGGPFAINPVLTFYMPVGSALLGGPVFLLLLAKVPKRGTAFIAGLLLGLVMFATGMHWAMVLGYILMGLAGDFIAGIRSYKNIYFNIIAYIALSLGATGSYIVYFIDRQGWNRLMLEGGTDQAYLDSMAASVYTLLPAVIIGGTIVAGLLSGLFGKRLLRKQFERAGIAV